MCGIIGIFKYEGNANVELYEGLLMLQHRGQDSAGMVTTDWNRFKEYKENGLVKDVFANQDTMDSMKGKGGGGEGKRGGEREDVGVLLLGRTSLPQRGPLSQCSIPITGYGLRVELYTPCSMWIG